MLAFAVLAPVLGAILAPLPPRHHEQRAALAKQLERERAAVARSEAALRALDGERPDSVALPGAATAGPALGYLSKTAAGCYSTADGGPPPSAMTLALSNFRRELPEMVAAALGRTRPPQGAGFADALHGRKRPPQETGYADALQRLGLSNDAVHERERAREQVPAPLLIKLPYDVLCGGIDALFGGRPIARFWFLETVARMPYQGYATMLFLYETLGWWRRSADLKQVHFDEEWNEFHHLLIMESLGGDQAWSDRFLAQHSALLYYVMITAMWLVSPTLAYNFSELLEAHAVDTYAEFIDANEGVLRGLPPPQIAVDFYAEHGVSTTASLYDVFCRVRDDEADHVTSMKACQDGDVRARARILEFGAIATAAAVLATSAATVETVEIGVESVERAPIVRAVEQELADELSEVERDIGAVASGAASGFDDAMQSAERGGNQWQGYAPAPVQ